MIMLNDLGEVKFKYSSEKLSRVKSLFTVEGFKLLKSFIESLDHKTNNIVQFGLINNNQPFTSSYLEYLSNYANNLVLFTKPQPVDIELNDFNFKLLFEKFVFEFPKEKIATYSSTASELDIIKESFLPKVSKRVNINYTLKAEKHDYLVFDMQLDMIGKNDRPVLNQFIEFGSNHANLQKSIQSYLSLVKPLELNAAKPGKFFISGDEPPKSLKKQHLIWEQLRNSNLVSNEIVEMVPSSDLEKIEEYLNEHDVRPFYQE
jgi:hypothetical protein